MPQTKEFGPKKRSRLGITYRVFFIHVIWLKWWTWPIEFSTTHSNEEPFLAGRSIIVHFWPTKLGLVIGKWQNEADDEDAHLVNAVNPITKNRLKKHVYRCGARGCATCAWEAFDEELLERFS